MRLRLLLLVAAILAAPLMPETPDTVATARAAAPPFHELWRADRSSGFAGWSLQGAQMLDGRLALDPAASLPQGIEGLTPPTGQAGTVGLAVAPIQATSAQFHELIPSWNAETPPGTWIEVRLRANIGEAGHWTS